MRSNISIPADVANQQRIERLVEVLRTANGPMMIREIAEAMPASLTTAGKYVDICQAAGIVTVKPYATAKQVSLARSTGRDGVGVR